MQKNRRFFVRKMKEFGSTKKECLCRHSFIQKYYPLISAAICAIAASPRLQSDAVRL